MKGDVTEYQIRVGSVKSGSSSRQLLKTIEGQNSSTSHILWTIEFDFYGKKLKTKQYFDLSSALDEIRGKIERKGYRLGVRWSEKDAHQSGMLSDMSAGTLMYYIHEVDAINQKENHSGGYPTYHILEETELDKVVPLELQKRHLQKSRALYKQGLKPFR